MSTTSDAGVVPAGEPSRALRFHLATAANRQGGRPGCSAPRWCWPCSICSASTLRGWLVGPRGSDQQVPGRSTSSPVFVFQTGQTVLRDLRPRHLKRRVPRGSDTRAHRRRVCGRRVHEQFLTGEHRQVFSYPRALRFVAIIPSAHGRRLRPPLNLVQKTSFLHVVATFRLPVPLLRCPGRVHESLGNTSYYPGEDDPDRGRGGYASCSSAHLRAAGQEALGAGEAGRSDPQDTGRYLTRAILRLVAGFCKVAVTGIFLAAFAFPSSAFELIMWITGSGSLANVVPFTPGAVGIPPRPTNACRTPCDGANETDRRLLYRAAADRHGLELWCS